MSRLLTLLASVALASCVSSPGNTTYYPRAQDPTGTEDSVRGVVNGIYEYAPDKTFVEMSERDEHLSPAEVQTYSKRYVVRVGVERTISVHLADHIYADYVLLPEGWTHAAQSISDDRKVINVGDVVDLRLLRGRYYDFVDSLVRQCFDAPLADENPDWNIGCKTYEGFNRRGYAGEHYFWTIF